MAETGSQVATFKDRAEADKDPASTWRFWMDAWDVATETEEDWVKEADQAVKIWRSDKNAKRAFNILHANVQVKVPAVYNSTPEPDVRSRDRSNKNVEDNEAARLGAQTIELALRYELDEYDFDDVARAVVRDSQISGRGVGRVVWKTYKHKDVDEGQTTVWEEVSCKRVPWRFFRRGPGHSWDECPWVGYQHAVTRDDLYELLKDNPDVESILKDVNFDLTELDAKTKDKENIRDPSVYQRTELREIWDKLGRQVLFICPGYDKGPLVVDPDPYGLLEFFDCDVIQPLTDPDGLTPICPYTIYKEQAEELAAISQRILALTNCLKFRGVRAAEIPEFDKIEDAQDGEFLVSNGAMALIGGSKGLSDAIWVMPIKEIADTIQQLLLNREAMKQTIYEITAISDVMRGATDPDETLGAQQIKAQSGSLRAHDEQQDVQKFCRNQFRKKAELIANKFQPETLSAIVGEELAPEVMNVLRSDVRRHYLIDIETNSTIRGDLARNQKNMEGFMGAAGQFIQTFVPLIQSGSFPPQLAQAAITVFGAFAKQFKMGKVVDDTLAQLEEAAKQWMESQQNDPEKEAKKKEAEELERRGAQATVAELEGKAEKTFAEAEHVKVKTETMVHDARRNTATAVVDIKGKAAEARKKEEEVEAQKVETAQQAVDLEHKQVRGPWAADPTEIEKAKINADAQVQRGQQSADATVASAGQKARGAVGAARETSRAAAEQEGPTIPSDDSDGFVA